MTPGYGPADQIRTNRLAVLMSCDVGVLSPGVDDTLNGSECG